MNYRTGIFAITVAIAGICGSPAQAQNFIGEAIGKVITPMVGPVLERAAVEGGAELIRRGYENGRFRRRRPSPQPVNPSPGYTRPGQPNYGQPNYGQPTYTEPTYSNPLEAPSQPPVAPPDNEVIVWPTPPTNGSASDQAMTFAMSRGTRQTGQVMIREAEGIANSLEQMGSGPALDQARSSAATLIEVVTSGDQAQIKSAMESLRSAMAAASHDVADGQSLAVVAQRVKNLGNMAVVNEIAKVLSVQRRDDLIARVAQAAIKSDAPDAAVTALLGLAVGDNARVTPSFEMPAGVPSTLLYNDPANSSVIHFLCDDELKLSLAPGESVPFDTRFVLAFQDGVSGVKRYTIKEGVFRFVVGESGWDIKYKTKVPFTLDNTAGTQPFHYLLGGEPHVVAAGETASHELTGPPRIDFDAGAETPTVKSKLMIPGNYQVAADPETLQWDLYPASGNVASVDSVSEIAKRHWGDSLRVVMEGRSTPTDTTVDSLLDAIE